MYGFLGQAPVLAVGGYNFI